VLLVSAAVSAAIALALGVVISATEHPKREEEDLAEPIPAPV
jgi:hypothetical protein